MTIEQLKQALDICSEHEACENCPAREYCGDLGIVTGEALSAIERLEAEKEIQTAPESDNNQSEIRLIIEAKPPFVEIVKVLADTFAFDTSEELTAIVNEALSEDEELSKLFSVRVEVAGK